MISMALAIDFIPDVASLIFGLTSDVLAEILFHCLISMVRVVIALFFGSFFGVCLGLIAGYHRGFDRILSPFIWVTYPFPKVILVPILLLIFGVGELSKFLLLALVSFYQLYITTRSACRDISLDYILAFQSFSTSKWQLFRHVLLPASLNAILTALKIGLQIAFALLFVTETYGTSQGIGYLVWDAFASFNYPLVYQASFIFCLQVWLLFKIVEWGESKFLLWQRK